MSTKGISCSSMKFIFSETSIMIPIGANNKSITPKVDRYFFRMYLSIIVNINVESVNRLFVESLIC